MNTAVPIHARGLLGSIVTLSAFVLLALGASAVAGSGTLTVGASVSDSAAAEGKAQAAYAKLPLAFVANAGQLDRRVAYSAQAGGASFYFTKQGAVFSFAGQGKGLALRLAFVGANPEVAISARRQTSGRVNYLLGDDPAKWRTNLPTYGEVVYDDLWPGVDMVFRGAAGQLKYEFHVRPGASVSKIRLAYRGASGLSLARSGALRIQTARGVLTDAAPSSYQVVGGNRVHVVSRYALHGRHGYGFALGPGYDPARPLVIDPGLLYSTYLGGSSFDQGNGIAVDGVGNAYVTGETSSLNFPTASLAFDTIANGGTDAFVTKLNPAGSAPLIYSTYLGGSSLDQGRGIALDGGSAYVVGRTTDRLHPSLFDLLGRVVIRSGLRCGDCSR